MLFIFLYCTCFGIMGETGTTGKVYTERPQRQIQAELFTTEQSALHQKAKQKH